MAHLSDDLKRLVREIQIAVVNYLKNEYRRDDPECFYCDVDKVEYTVWEGDLDDVYLKVAVRFGYYAGDDCDDNFQHTLVVEYLDPDWTADFIHGFVTAYLYGR